MEEILKKFWEAGVMHEATLSKAFSFEQTLAEHAQTLQLRQCAVSRQSEQFNCLCENYAKGIDKCLEWCGEDMCQKPSN